jgi:hypothetical protein
MKMNSNIQAKTNLAMRQFCLGNVNEAQQLFTQALLESRQACSTMEEAAFASPPHSTERDEQGKHDVPHTTVKDHMQSSAVTGAVDDRVYIHDQTFVFFEISAGHTLPQCALRSLFNVATCHYWKGSTASTHHHLETARKLYELTYKMMSNGGIGMIPPILMLATTNNLGQIHGWRGDSNVSNIYFQHLLQALMYYTQDVDSTDYSSEIPLLSDALREHFFASTMHLILKNQGFAAAA